ncbi:SH3 domain-containing protein [Candidimonas sp. SYP-B2681]|uniref:SH3 domain-containing protein n=1 Tax=Candidimonas sp. SYP-B2681 TaxID=2497686 RepID=UPI000F878B42|nr:SH3 domain-containing protein [Candidimonas sp. SYP-B2681]RTZ48042.1 SH3 domain-containing protein [Candidimonas sp. SYP-B2681]
MAQDVWRKALGIESFEKFAKAHEETFQPLKQHREWLEKLHNPSLRAFSLQDYARQLERGNPALREIAAAKKSFDSLWKTFTNVDFSAVELLEEDEEEAERAAQAITGIASTQLTFFAAVTQITHAIQSQQNPTVQLMLYFFFDRILDWIGSALVAALINQQLPPPTPPQSPQKGTKNIKPFARAAIEVPELLNEYRFVSAKVLNVRQNPRGTSPQIARLYFGNPVRIIKKDGDFILVRWTDKESDVEIQGWVFARYLERFA